MAQNPIFERILSLKNIKRENVKALFSLTHTNFFTQDFSQLNKFLHFTVGYDLVGLIEIALGERLRVRTHEPLKSYSKHISIYFEGNTFTANERFVISQSAKQTFAQSGASVEKIATYLEENSDIDTAILHFPNIAECLENYSKPFVAALQAYKLNVCINIAGEKTVEMKSEINKHNQKAALEKVNAALSTNKTKYNWR